MPTGQRDVARLQALKPAFDRLYAEFNVAHSLNDPVWLVRDYDDPADREIAGFCAAGLAFGRVASILTTTREVLTRLGPRPARVVHAFEPARDGRRFLGVVHRWTRGADLVALFTILQSLLDEFGSLERAFSAGHDPAAPDVTETIERFCVRAGAVDVSVAYEGATAPRGVTYFFPRPSGGSACKRLNLFLRWMVRRDRVDPGGWRAISPAQLVVPLDTHVVRVGQCLGLTRYRSAGWPMAADITASLRAIDPLDPVKYDFSLCHLGIENACGFNRPQGDERCPLSGVCRPSVGRRRPFRGPPARR